jgi:peptide/nickel transport system permease protein
MGRYILKRLLWIIPIVLGVSILIFTILYFIPGDPVAIILGVNSTPSEQHELRETMGLNKPFLVQLGIFLKEFFIDFNFGVSYFSGRSITTELFARFPRTFTIAFSCMLLMIIAGITLGINAAVHQNKTGDRISIIIALLGVSMPPFWVALLLVLLFSLKLGWLPPSGIGSFKNFILPSIAISFGGIAEMARQTRSSMLEVIRSDFIVTAKAKGLSRNKSTWFHAFPNALIPSITIAGMSFGRMLGGTIVIETVFSIPGIGLYLINAINNRDYPVLRGSVVFLSITFSIVMLLVDILYAFIDPRIKSQYEARGARGMRSK